MVVPKKYLDDVVDFCNKYDIPYIGSQFLLFEGFYADNPQTAWKEWIKVYTAYTDDKLKYDLNRWKNG